MNGVCNYNGKPPIRDLLLELLKLLVEHVNAESISNQLQVGVILGQLVDGLHLLSKELLFKIVGQVGIIVSRGNFVDIQQRLIHLKRIKQNNYFSMLGYCRT